MTTETADFVIGGYTFTVGINTVRQERGRTSLIAAKNRYLYGDKFETELERRPSLDSMDPIYSDLIGALRAIDNNPKHDLITQFVYSPEAWDDFFWDHYEDRAVIIQAAIWAQTHHEWYPKPQVEDEDDPEAAQVVAATLAAIDVESTEDREQPDTEDILEAVQKRADIAFDKRGEDFLESETSLIS